MTHLPLKKKKKKDMTHLNLLKIIIIKTQND